MDKKLRRHYITLEKISKSQCSLGSIRYRYRPSCYKIALQSNYLYSKQLLYCTHILLYHVWYTFFQVFRCSYCPSWSFIWLNICKSVTVHPSSSSIKRTCGTHSILSPLKGKDPKIIFEQKICRNVSKILNIRTGYTGG